MYSVPLASRRSGPRKCIDDLSGWMSGTALLAPQVVLGADAGKGRQLLAAQTRNTPPSAAREPHVFGTNLLAARTQIITQRAGAPCHHPMRRLPTAIPGQIGPSVKGSTQDDDRPRPSAPPIGPAAPVTERPGSPPGCAGRGQETKRRPSAAPGGPDNNVCRVNELRLDSRPIVCGLDAGTGTQPVANVDPWWSRLRRFSCRPL